MPLDILDKGTGGGRKVVIPVNCLVPEIQVVSSVQGNLGRRIGPYGLLHDPPVKMTHAAQPVGRGGVLGNRMGIATQALNVPPT